MIRYVAGFVFIEDTDNVVLIKKTKPIWQHGRLNAVGGKVEQGESVIQAMHREMKEETGADIPVERWRRFCVLRGTSSIAVMHMCGCDSEGFVETRNTEEWEVHFFFSSITIQYAMDHVWARTEEQIFTPEVSSLTVDNSIPNVPWLITMARNMDKDIHRRVHEYVITEQYEDCEHRTHRS